MCKLSCLSTKQKYKYINANALKGSVRYFTTLCKSVRTQSLRKLKYTDSEIVCANDATHA